MKTFGLAVLGAIGGYLIGLCSGMLLVENLSNNRHDRSVEAAMTGAFVIGPLMAATAVIIVLVLRFRRSRSKDAGAMTLRLMFYLLVLLHLSSFPVHAAAGSGKTEVMPMVKAAPTAVVIETRGTEADLRNQLRSKNAVTGLGSARAPFSQAPTGTYGFIAPQLLGMALVTQSPDLVLESTAPASNAYEIHKLADGSGMVVGFIEEALIPQVTPENRPHHIRIALCSNRSDKTPYIAAMPLTKLMVDRMPVRLDAKRADGPVVLEMDLQSTANRKSVPGIQ
jgi:hypothetical protein